MKYLFSAFLFFVALNCNANNPFLDRLTKLNQEIIFLQIKIKIADRLDKTTLKSEIIILKEKIIRLKQDTQKDFINNQTYSSEFNDLMGIVSDLANLKLDLLTTFKRTESNFYLEKYNQLNTAYTDLYGKLLLSSW